MSASHVTLPCGNVIYSGCYVAMAAFANKPDVRLFEVVDLNDLQVYLHDCHDAPGRGPTISVGRPEVEEDGILAFVRAPTDDSTAQGTS